MNFKKVFYLICETGDVLDRVEISYTDNIIDFFYTRGGDEYMIRVEALDNQHYIYCKECDNDDAVPMNVDKINLIVKFIKASKIL